MISPEISVHFGYALLCIGLIRFTAPLQVEKRAPSNSTFMPFCLASPGESSPIFPRIPVKALILLLLGLLWVCAQVSRKYQGLRLKCSDPLSLGASPALTQTLWLKSIKCSDRSGLGSLGSWNQGEVCFSAPLVVTWIKECEHWWSRNHGILIHRRSLTMLQIFVYYPSLVPWPG